jgi:hypothetical protein
MIKISRIGYLNRTIHPYISITTLGHIYHKKSSFLVTGIFFGLPEDLIKTALSVLITTGSLTS